MPNHLLSTQSGFRLVRTQLPKQILHRPLLILWHGEYLLRSVVSTLENLQFVVQNCPQGIRLSIHTFNFNSLPILLKEVCPTFPFAPQSPW